MSDWKMLIAFITV